MRASADPKPTRFPLFPISGKSRPSCALFTAPQSLNRASHQPRGLLVHYSRAAANRRRGASSTMARRSRSLLAPSRWALHLIAYGARPRPHTKTLPRPRRRGQARPLVRSAAPPTNHDFAVLDTPKDPAWAGLLEKGRQNIDVLVNDEHVTTLDFHDGLSQSNGASLIVTDDVEALGATLARATTVSCSLGPFLNPVMTHLFDCAQKAGSTDKKTLYCCENDHSAVVQLRDELGDRVDVVDCVVDRVSTKRAVGCYSRDDPHVVRVVGRRHRFSRSSNKPQEAAALRRGLRGRGPRADVPCRGRLSLGPKAPARQRHAHDARFFYHAKI